MEQINKYKLTASMVRGFFVGFFSGLLDSKVPDWKKNKDARVLKKLAADALLKKEINRQMKEAYGRGNLDEKLVGVYFKYFS